MEAKGSTNKISYYVKQPFCELINHFREMNPAFPFHQFLNETKQSMLNLFGYEKKNASRKDYGSANEDVKEFCKEISVRIFYDSNDEFVKKAFGYYCDYLAMLSRDGVSNVQQNEDLLENVVHYYFRERLCLVGMLGTIIRKSCAKDDHQGNDVELVFQKCAEWWIDNGLLLNCQKELEKLQDVQSLLMKIEKLKLSPNEEVDRKKEMIEQLLKELAAILDLIFIIQYKNFVVPLKFFEDFFKFCIEIDFGWKFRSFSPLASKSRVGISRIASLCILNIIETLNIGDTDDLSNKNLSQEKITKFKGFISQVKGKESRHGALYLIWASFLRLNMSNHNHDIQMKEIVNFAERGLRSHGLQFFTHMLDRSNPDYPFHGNRDHIVAYHSEIDQLLWSLLKVFHTSSPPLIRSMVNLTKLTLSTPTKDSSLRRQYFHDFKAKMLHYNQKTSVSKLSMQDIDPHILLYLNSEKYFPCHSDSVTLLAEMVCDEESAEFLWNQIDQLKYHCIELSWDDYRSKCKEEAKDSSSFIRSSFVVPYTDFITGIDINSKQQLIRIHTTSKRVYLSYRHSFSGWVLILSNLFQAIKLMRLANSQKSRSHAVYMIQSLRAIEAMTFYASDTLLEKLNHLCLTLGHERDLNLFQLLVTLYDFLVNTEIDLDPEILTCCIRSLKRFTKSFPVETIYYLQQISLTKVVEKDSDLGNYDCTIALLNNILSLSKFFPLSASSNMDSIIHLISSHIFSVHECWRYQKLEQRWKITKTCLKIFYQNISDSLSNDNLLHAFYHNRSFFQILFLNIGNGAQILQQLIRQEKNYEALLVEELVTTALEFLELLLKLKLSSQEKGKISPTPFEEVLMTKLVGKYDIPLIATIFEFIDHTYSSKVSIISSRVINLIAKITEHYHPRPPSLVGYLNRTSSQSTVMVNKCLTRLSQDITSYPLRTSLFELIATAVELQRGLADKFLDLEDSSENDDIIHLIISTINKYVQKSKVEIEESQVIEAAIRVIKNVFKRGEYTAVMERLQESEDFWNCLVQLLKRTLKDNDSITQDPFAIQATSSALYIMALHVYGSEQIGKPDNEFFSRLDDGNIIEKYLQQTIRHLIFICDDSTLARRHERACEEYKLNCNANFRMETYKVNVVGNLDVFDINKLIRWENQGIFAVRNFSQALNERFSLCDSYLSTVHSIHSLISSSSIKKRKQNFLNMGKLYNIVMVAYQTRTHQLKLNYFQEEFDQLSIHYPLPPILGKLTRTVHRCVSKLLLCTAKACLSSFGDTTVVSQQVISTVLALNAQISRKEESVAHTFLGILLFWYTQLPKRTVTTTEAYQLTPSLMFCLKNSTQVKNKELSVLILSLFSSDYLSKSEISELCGELLEQLALPASSYLNSLLSLVLRLCYTKRGCLFVVESGFIQSITHSSVLPRGDGDPKLYDQEKRTSWHLCWIMMLKLLLVISTTARRIHRFSKELQNMNYDEIYTASELSRQVTELIAEFCVAHKSRMIRILTTTLDKTEVTLAELEELELISDIMYELGKGRKLFKYDYFADAIKVAIVKGVTTTERINKILLQVTPVTDLERKLYNQHSFSQQDASNTNMTPGNKSDILPMDEFRYNTREHLTWTARVNLSVYGSLQRQLGAVRFMTDMIQSSVELNRIFRPVFPIAQHSRYPSVKIHILSIVVSCRDLLRKIKEGIQNQGTVSEKFEYNERSSKILSRVLIATLNEALCLATTHLMIYSEGSSNEKDVHDLYVELNNTIKISLKHMTSMEVIELLEEVQQFLVKHQETFSSGKGSTQTQKAKFTST